MAYDYLYSKPGYLAGIARTLDLFGTFSDYNYSRSSDEHLSRALEHDWLAVAKSLQDAMRATEELREIEIEHAKKLREIFTQGETSLSPTFLRALEDRINTEDLRNTTYLPYFKALRAAAKKLTKDHQSREKFRAILHNATREDLRATKKACKTQEERHDKESSR